jgi:hypothetical protein
MDEIVFLKKFPAALNLDKHLRSTYYNLNENNTITLMQTYKPPFLFLYPFEDSSQIDDERVN